MGKIKDKRKKVLKNIMEKEIFDAVAKVLNDFGAEGLTMDKVANEADVAKGTLYLYFKNRDDLIAKFIKKLRTPIIEKILEIKKTDYKAPEKIETIFRYLLTEIEQKLSLVKVVFRAIEAKEHLKAGLREDDEILISIFTEIFKQGRKEGSIRIQDSRYAAKILFACWYFMIKERAENHKNVLSIGKELKSFMSIVKYGTTAEQK